MQDPGKEISVFCSFYFFPFQLSFSQGVTVAPNARQAQNVNVCLFRDISNVFVLCVSRATDQNRQGNSYPTQSKFPEGKTRRVSC